LISDAQERSPTIEQAAARIAQARASYTSLTSSLLPSFTANASDNRSKGGQQAQFSPGGANVEQRSRSLSLDAAWELDVVGGARRARAASINRVDARVADWHDARVSIAAEVATQYVNLRTCEVLLSGYEADAASRGETARLTALKRDAGFEAPANAALAEASRAEATARLTNQRAECDVLVKVLAEITAITEPDLRARLTPRRAQLPQPKSFSVTEVPADLLSQRPDLASAEGEVIATLSEIGLAMADRFPRISLTGSIGYSEFTGGSEFRGRSWNWGPVLSLPIFDAGKRAANVDAARARQVEAAAQYRAKVLRAVREVEESLVRLESARLREADATSALTGYQQYLRATEARVKVGAASIAELEEARRAVVAAQGNAVAATRDRLSSTINLYKAVGGGYGEKAASPMASNTVPHATNTSTSATSR
jgi:NodT family efflux transporter outer membrane factor (OMF) lipoprotein